MKIYIVGIAGTFMAGFAVIARRLGWEVSGCDAHVYPPMSEQLATASIEYNIGFDINHAKASRANCFVIGNAMSRGNPIVEWVLDNGLPYASAPELLGRHLLQKKHVIAVSGTHGKTTTTALLTHILSQCGYKPSYLIGGLVQHIPFSADLTDSDYFVIEADEYDTAFFDKRSKFMHYHANTLVINNLEFDHADIFASYKDIEKTFHHLVRTLPSNGCIIHHNQARVQRLLKLGCYSKVLTCGPHKASDLRLVRSTTQAVERTQKLTLMHKNKLTNCTLPLLGAHNRANALSALLAANNIGISIEKSAATLTSFAGVRKRQEVFLEYKGALFFEDFAHHPTAISQTADAMRSQVKKEGCLWLVVDPRSNTMKKGILKQALLRSLTKADYAILYAHQSLSWSYDSLPANVIPLNNVNDIIKKLKESVKSGDCVIIMSNGSFEGLKQKLLKQLI